MHKALLLKEDLQVAFGDSIAEAPMLRRVAREFLALSGYIKRYADRLDAKEKENESVQV